VEEAEISKDDLDALPPVPNEIEAALRFWGILMWIIGGREGSIPPSITRHNLITPRGSCGGKTGKVSLSLGKALYNRKVQIDSPPGVSRTQRRGLCQTIMSSQAE